MSKFLILFLLTFCSTGLTGCGEPAGNANSANNGNTSNAPVRATRPAGVPNQAALMELEKNAFEAWKNRDASYFQQSLADTFTFVGPGGRMDKASVIRYLTSPECTVSNYSFSDEAMTLLGPDAAAMTFKATSDAACGGQKLPSPRWAATVFLREGENWKATYHSEVPMGSSESAGALPAEHATEETAIDPLTQGLLNAENVVWQARQKNNQQILDAVTMRDLVYIDAAGSGRQNKEQAVKQLTGPGCTIEGYALTDAQSRPLGSNIAVLTYKGTAKGSCGGRPLRPIWATTTFMKEQNFWKPILIIHSPA